MQCFFKKNIHQLTYSKTLSSVPFYLALTHLRKAFCYNTTVDVSKQECQKFKILSCTYCTVYVCMGYSMLTYKGSWCCWLFLLRGLELHSFISSSLFCITLFIIDFQFDNSVLLFCWLFLSFHPFVLVVLHCWFLLEVSWYGYPLGLASSCFL